VDILRMVRVVDRIALGTQAALQVPDATLPCRLIPGTTAKRATGPPDGQGELAQRVKGSRMGERP